MSSPLTWKRTPILSDVSYSNDRDSDDNNDSDADEEAVDPTIPESDFVPCDSLKLPRNETELRIAAAIVRLPRHDYSVRLVHSVSELACYAMLDEETGDDESANICGLFQPIATSVSFHCYTCYSTLTVLQILLTMDPKVLKTLVTGNIFADESLSDSLRTLKENTANTPCIYVRGLVNREGLAPSALEWDPVLSTLLDYVSGEDHTHDTVCKIDSQFRGSETSVERSREGFRSYINGKKVRVQQVITFCLALRTRLRAIKPEDRHLPMKKPHYYVRYTSDFSSREKAHIEGSTSWLQHLVRSAFAIHHEGFNFKQTPVVFMWRADQVKVAEILVTTITDSKYQTGGGFCVCPAGISTPLPQSVNERELWEAAEKWRDDNTNYHSNKEAELTYFKEQRELPDQGRLGPNRGPYEPR